MIIEHLLKLQFAPAAEPRRRRRQIVRTARNPAEDLLNDSPSLSPEVPKLIEAVRQSAVQNGLLSFGTHDEGEVSRAAKRFGGSYEYGEITGDWFPPEPVT